MKEIAKGNAHRGPFDPNTVYMPVAEEPVKVKKCEGPNHPEGGEFIPEDQWADRRHKYCLACERTEKGEAALKLKKCKGPLHPPGGELLPVTEFPRDSSRQDGLNTICRNCRSQRRQIPASLDEEIKAFVLQCIEHRECNIEMVKDGEGLVITVTVK